MSQKQTSSGVVHEMPADLKKVLASDPQALAAWEDITPLARNEWICWIESAKKAETRSRRIEWGCSSLKDGKRRAHVVGPDAPIANAKLVKPDLRPRTGIGQLPVFAWRHQNNRNSAIRSLMEWAIRRQELPARGARSGGATP